MAVGIYGTIRPADVSVDDIDVYYNYTPDRETTANDIFKLDATEILTYNYLPEEEEIVGNENLLEGLYNLRLPASVFGQLGIYTIYMKRKYCFTSQFQTKLFSRNMNSRVPENYSWGFL